MRTITNNELKTANRDAYKAGTLAFQSTLPDCVYEDEHGRRCSIGVVLHKDELEEIGSMHDQVEELEKLGILDFADIKFAAKLQDAHDQIVRAKRMGETYENRLGYFGLIIGHNIKKELEEKAKEQ